MKIIKTISYLLTMPIVFAATNAYSAQSNSIESAIKNGEAYLDARYRYEFVDQKNLDNANASTLRTKLGYKTEEFKGVSGLLEFENILEVGESRYNNTINGKSENATVADPKGTQVNQVYLNWKAPAKTNVRVGRQIVNLDNQRFIGSVGWRQNDQTLDAAVISNNYFKNFNFTYAFVERINRIFSDESAVGIFDNNNANIINTSYNGFKFGKITAYNYLLDVEDAPSISSKTTGIRVNGKYPLGKSSKALYQLEYAYQSDYGDNATNYNADYVSAELGVANKGFTLKGGYEELGSDGNASFQTPLATLHKFNGFADKFLTTPTDGLRDFYGTIKYKVKSKNILNNLVTLFTFHDFSSDKNSSHYGEEYDFLVKKQINKNYNFGLKAAFYKADEFSVDTTKIMAFTGVKF